MHGIVSGPFKLDCPLPVSPMPVTITPSQDNGKRRPKPTTYIIGANPPPPKVLPQGLVRIPYCCIASIMPWKINAIPMADTKKPTIRVAASTPFGPIRCRIFRAYASMMKMANIAAKIPPAIAAMRLKSENGCLTSEDMPMTVAIAPGPNMMGMARGTKATFLSRRVESLPPVGMTSFEEDGKNRLKPIRRRTIPPTMRTILRGTSKIFNIAVPNTRKKKSRRVA